LWLWQNSEHERLFKLQFITDDTIARAVFVFWMNKIMIIPFFFFSLNAAKGIHSDHQ